MDKEVWEDGVLVGWFCLCDRLDGWVFVARNERHVEEDRARLKGDKKWDA